jgi:hypothetical protein
MNSPTAPDTHWFGHSHFCPTARLPVTISLLDLLADFFFRIWIPTHVLHLSMQADCQFYDCNWSNMALTSEVASYIIAAVFIPVIREISVQILFLSALDA